MDFPFVLYLPILLCSVLGIGFLILEVFLPGFGLPGITGILLEVAAVVLAALRFDAITAFCVALVILAITAAAVMLALRSIRKGKLSKSSIILQEEEHPLDSDTMSQDLSSFIGSEGLTLTPLHPLGTAEVNGIRLTVTSEGEYLPKDTHVKVSRTEGTKIIVVPINS